MNQNRVRTCDERFHAAGGESLGHRWAKLELYRRKQREKRPWFDGEYRFEKKVADRVPDCFTLRGPVDRWIEFVDGAPQDYRAKTREALRLGFVIHWVFSEENRDQVYDAEDALQSALREPFRFGRYDPDEGTLDLGDPITYKNYEFPVTSMFDFKPHRILGYRAGAVGIGQEGKGYDVGMFDIAGYRCRILARPGAYYFRAVEPGEPVDKHPWGWPTREGLERIVDAENVTRLGPVKRRDS